VTRKKISWVGRAGLFLSVLGIIWGGWERAKVRGGWPEPYQPFFKYSVWPQAVLLLGIALLVFWLALRIRFSNR
jgi:hypothetical protein